jgi:2-oxoisovalerate dehydrogenase E1 component alpha subunit
VVYRITPHSSDDDDRSYRSREEVEENKRKDGLLQTRQQMERDGLLTAEEVAEMEARALEMVNEAVAYAENAPYPTPEEGLYPVYAADTRPQDTQQQTPDQPDTQLADHKETSRG